MTERINIRKKEYLNDSPLSKAGIFIKLAAIVVIIMLLVISANSLMEYSRLINETEKIDAEIESVIDRVEELEYLIDVPKNDKSLIIRIAKERLGLVLPEEIIYYSESKDK